MKQNFPTIARQEFSTRIEALRKSMRANGVDLFVGFSNLLDPSTVRYFADFAAVNESAAIVVPLEGEITLCSGQASYDYALIKNALDGAVIRVFPEIGEVSGFEYDFEGQLEFGAFFQALQESGKFSKIGLAGKLIFPAVIYNKLTAAFVQAEIVDFDSEVYALRAVKSQAEIACMQKCADIISHVFTTVVPNIQEGMTELEIQAMFESEILRAGGESYVQAFAPMVATGQERSHISMTRNTLRRVQKSEILNIAAGVCYEGYNGIICSPVVLGDVPDEISHAVLCAYDALNTAASHMKAGVSCKTVLDAYTEFLTEKGYIDYCPYGSLHSTGMLECEAPVFSVDNGRMLEENMIICIDAYFKGMAWGSFRIEDFYLVTKDGAKRLTTYNDSALETMFTRRTV